MAEAIRRAARDATSEHALKLRGLDQVPETGAINVPSDVIGNDDARRVLANLRAVLDLLVLVWTHTDVDA